MAAAAWPRIMGGLVDLVLQLDERQHGNRDNPVVILLAVVLEIDPD